MDNLLLPLVTTLLIASGAVEAKDFTQTQCPVVGNTNSHIYHVKGCPNFPQMLEKNKHGDNRACFSDRKSAENAGYRIARNCRKEVYLRKDD